ncbi:hypothetical protein [Maricaulis maris]|uniref:hypothetical protein n=1 Tax=Maricaulis maris TaxID=74318 RepID=UPI003B8B813A
MKAIIISILLISAHNRGGQDSDSSPTLSDLVGEFNLLYGFHTSAEPSLSELQNLQFSNYLSWKFVRLLEVAEQTTELEPHMSISFCRIVRVSDQIVVPDSRNDINVHATLEHVYLANNLNDEGGAPQYCYETREYFDLD